ncbi:MULTISPECIES: 4a-hydroxytetrahydrobiopterin dehydratase [unclassified Janthinobacterium]|uniref:4a-hydroxytetrahydrobiopterin dehydratase n=1 Tax=unclassified Janthinobacterium TaxID=2610881 RepID=UPI0016082E93|nr:MULTISPECIES: 4a-hydroxytetrahydrobiopterin dehydratase [unclassified Janthinobacterium]MBB5369431.1 4a-hydroxytetrahydrobiopterin dehydratase [Janthinobacterium sp. K2C7]MBB5381033.1 4a-hydroxytetrahydrobiopterin dehydratase [Janthinobacterium sp. K2Li3]MBB5387814.1 4a-hydroxytetrahydrobiopterin dehydratase [Janthinobacterium sp. K2E3]
MSTDTVPLEQQDCSPQQQALSDVDAAALLALLPQWSLQNGKLCRDFGFKNYYQTLAFVNALAHMTHKQDHHPELIINYKTCAVRYDTHSVNEGAGGLSANDFICAAKADLIYDSGVTAP